MKKRKKIEGIQKKVDREKYLEINYKNKVGEKIFLQILNSDPTFNKQYSQWILNLYLKITNNQEKSVFLEDLASKTKEDLSLFYKHKDKLPLEARDINNYKNLSDLYQAIKTLASTDNLQSKTEILKEVKKEIDVLLDSERWLVLIPKTKKASILYGKGTRWCTAAEKHNYYENYAKDGPLYIIIDKQADPKNKNFHKIHKHQFHFESNQFMDAEDVSIKYEDFLMENPELLKVFSGLKNDFSFRLKLLFNLPISEEEKIVYVSNNKVLDLSNIKCETLPEGLVIHGSLKLDNSEHIKYIKDITVYGNLSINNSSIKYFEGKLHVGGLLEANNCKNLETLPENFYVGATFRGKFCNFVKIPAGEIGSQAYLSDNPKLSDISKNLVVKGNLYANNTLIPQMTEKELRARFPNVKEEIFSSLCR